MPHAYINIMRVCSHALACWLLAREKKRSRSYRRSERASFVRGARGMRTRDAILPPKRTNTRCTYEYISTYKHIYAICSLVCLC